MQSAIVQHYIESMVIEDFAKQEMSKASYTSYLGPFRAYVIKQGWTYRSYSQIFSSGPIIADFFSNTKYDQYARPQMLKFTCETSLA